MKHPFAFVCLVFVWMPSFFSLHAQEATPQKDAATLKGGAAPAAEAAEKALDRPQVPAPRLKLPASVGADKLDLLPADSAEELKGKVLPLLPEASEVPLEAAVEEVKDRVVERVKKSKTELASDEMEIRVRFRLARTKALNDSRVQEIWEQSKKVKTDYERRELMQAYYGRIYGLMRKGDATLEKRIEQEERRAIQRFTQRRVTPTEPPAAFGERGGRAPVGEF
jgi:hypothetical protein